MLLVLAINYPKPWWINDSILSTIQIPLEGVHKIKEAERVRLSITMKRVPNDYITYEALKGIAQPDGELILFKNPYGRDYHEKNVETMVEVEVTKILPFGSFCLVDGVKTWIEFSYALHPFKLCQSCRTLDHSRFSCTPKRRELLAVKLALSTSKLLNPAFNSPNLSVIESQPAKSASTSKTQTTNKTKNLNPFSALMIESEDVESSELNTTQAPKGIGLIPQTSKAKESIFTIPDIQPPKPPYFVSPPITNLCLFQITTWKTFLIILSKLELLKTNNYFRSRFGSFLPAWFRSKPKIPNK